MRKIIVFLLSSMLLIAMVSMNVYAMPFNPNDYSSVDEHSELLPEGVKQSKVTERAIRRGDFFMAADLIISDKGDGNIGAIAKAYLQNPVDEVFIAVFLDRFNEKEDHWEQVTYYEDEFKAEDYPDGLISPTVNITFLDQKKNRYYRLRAAFAAHDGELVEGFSPVTAGILIE